MGLPGVNVCCLCLLRKLLRLYNHGIDFYVENMDPVGFTGMLNYLLLSLIQNNAFVRFIQFTLIVKPEITCVVRTSL